MRDALKRIRNDLRGIAAAEFALMAPIMMMLFLGGSELSRYLILHQKVEKVSNTVADLVGQTSAELLTTDQLDLLLSAATQVMLPFEFDSPGVVIISSVSNDGGGIPTVNWQYSGGGSMSASSVVGEQGQTATMPDGFTMSSTENVIVTEVFYTYETLLGDDLLDEQVLYKINYYRPRLGALTEAPT